MSAEQMANTLNIEARKHYLCVRVSSEGYSYEVVDPQTGAVLYSAQESGEIIAYFGRLTIAGRFA